MPKIKAITLNLNFLCWFTAWNIKKSVKDRHFVSKTAKVDRENVWKN